MHAYQYAGFTLIEIMIGFLLLFIVLLGTDALQLMALHKTEDNYYLNIASQQIDSMSERLKILNDGQYDDQLSVWNEQNQIVLPGGYGQLSYGDSGMVLSIFWGSKEILNCKNMESGKTRCLQTKIQG